MPGSPPAPLKRAYRAPGRKSFVVIDGAAAIGLNALQIAVDPPTPLMR
jgi:hypothetical protein